MNCLLCDEPVGSPAPYVLVALGHAHTACLAQIVRREVAHRHAVRSITEGPPVTPDASPWCPLEPFVSQWDFLAATAREVLFAGGVGGGKTTALLMSALQEVDQPGYSALLLKRWYPALVQPAGLLDVASRWLAGKITWGLNGCRATFPSGATLWFGSLDTALGAGRYGGMEFQFIGIDDVETLEQRQYEFLFSRLRPSQVDQGLPLRLRATTGQLPLDCPRWLLDRYCNRAADRRVVLTAHSTNPFLAPAFQRAQQGQRISYPTKVLDAELRRILHLPPDGAAQ